MSLVKLEADNRYLLQVNGLTMHPSLIEVECLEVSKTAYKIKFIQSNNVEWIDKGRFTKQPGFWGEYCVQEKLEPPKNYTQDQKPQPPKSRLIKEHG